MALLNVQVLTASGSWDSPWVADESRTLSSVVVYALGGGGGGGWT